MFIVIVVVIPTLFVGIMHLMELAGDAQIDWQRRLMKIGWDICVLALGMTGGLFADDAIAKAIQGFGPLAPIGLLLLGIVIALAAAGTILLLRRMAPVGWRAVLCLVLGCCTLVLTAYVALLRR